MSSNAYLRLLPDPRDLEVGQARRTSDAGLGGDGYDFIEGVGLRGPGWRVVASWGRDGWDLGGWPYVTFAHHDDGEVFALASRVEGDIDVTRYATRADLYEATDRAAEFHWRVGQSMGPSDVGDYPEGELPPEYRGPWGRSRDAS